MSKADNMLAILLLLRARRKWSARELAERLEIHIRTVYRCIDALCASGVPIVAETGRDGGYSIPERFKLEPLFFDSEEMKSLLHAARFARESGYPYEEVLSRAVAKIKRYAVPEQAERLEDQESYVDVVHPPGNAELSSLLMELERATDSRTSARLEYRTGYENRLTKRLFDPYGIVSWKDKWYTVGWCHLRGEIRHFRVDRIRRIELTDERFVRPAHFSARESLLGSLLPESGDESDEHRVTVTIAGTPQALDDLCGHWLFSRTLAERTEAQARFRLDEHNLYIHAPYYLLSFGGALQILEPAELRAHLADIAEGLLRFYRS